MIVDCAIYVDGRRSAPCSLEEIHDVTRARGGFAWVCLHDPTQEEFDSVVGEFGLRELALRDAVKVHQRPKIERYGDLIFVVLKSARYVEEKEEIEFGEVHAFVGKDFIVTVRHGEASELKEVRRQVEGLRVVPDGLIRLREEAPYDHLCFWGRLPGVTHEQALANMRLFASEVVPRVNDAVRA